MHGLLLPTLLLCSSLLATAANDDNSLIRTFCPSDANYTRGSAFQANLNALLSSLPATAAAAPTAYATNTTGTSPNKAYGLAQCRVDFVNTPDCGACLDGSVQGLAASNCAGQKKATIVYDNCLLRLSGESFAGAMDMSGPFILVNGQNATQPELFEPQLGSLMSNLTRKAAYESPRMMSAVGSATVTPFETIYGMTQCTRDLGAEDCNRCLQNAVSLLPNYCSKLKGCRVIYPSCAVQFEVYRFYNLQAAEAAMAPAAAPGGGLVNGSDHSGPGSNGHEDDEEIRSSESLLYDLSTLRTATDNFSEENKLGEGGFGPVYKGTLQNGQDIAVKRLSATSRQGQLEMRNEVFLLAKLQHKNLVRLLGCCIEKHERLLVYEFLTNNSLHKILFDPARHQELGWGLRHKIIEGIGRGLMYLHEDSRLTIIHRGLKASNILLDSDMNPKISDFGLAKLFNIDSSVGNTSHIAGTYGYMAPEYALRGIFSAKSDVFSYGVLVLEIVTGQRNTYTQASGPSEDLLTYVWRHWSRGSVQTLLEGCPDEGRRPQEMLRCIHVGLLCVQEDPNLTAPTAPAYTVPRHAFTANAQAQGAEGSTDGDRPRVPSRDHSINDVSISVVEPR